MQASSALCVLGVLVTSSSGLHCASTLGPSPGSGGDEGESAPEVVEGDEPRARPPPRSPVGPPFSPVTRLSRSDTLVTSTLRTTDGTLYEAGTFAGSVLVGGERLDSKGGDDVFLAKWRPDGALAWALSVGSKAREASPRLGDVVDERVRLIGMTDGEMDCGSGPLPKWTSETFFLCVFSSHDGAWLAGGTFPTGEP